MIGIYERVSSGKQDLASQHGELDVWAKGQTEPLRWYSDKFTGKTLNRPGLDNLLRDMRAGKIKTVVVWRMDRLGRTASGLTALFDELITRQVNFISLRDGVNLSTPAGRLMANVLASIAAFETEVRAERIAAGLARKRERVEAGEDTWNKGGRPKGTPAKLTREVKAAVRRELAEGKSKAAVARAFGLSRPTVYACLAD